MFIMTWQDMATTYLNVPKNKKKTFSEHSVRTDGPQLWNSLKNSLKFQSLLNISVINFSKS